MTGHRATGRRRAKLAVVLAAGVALVGTLIGYPQPSASAAPQTKYYDVSLVPPPAGSYATAAVQIENDPSSTQSFGSAEINFGSALANPPSVSSGWYTPSQPDPSRYPGLWLFTSPASDSIPPGSSLLVTFTLSSSATSSFGIATEVKQSNDFNGSGNNFVNLTGDPIVTPCAGSTTCSLSGTSATTGTEASASLTYSSPYVAYGSFGLTGQLTCDNQVTTTPGDPFLVESFGTPAYGTVSMTFPKSVVNNLANNGTPLMQVCARASYPFTTASGGQASQVGTSQYYDGLLPDCPSSVTATTVGTTLSPPVLCVLSRAKKAANETIEIYVSDFSDPSFW